MRELHYMFASGAKDLRVRLEWPLALTVDDCKLMLTAGRPCSRPRRWGGLVVEAMVGVAKHPWLLHKPAFRKPKPKAERQHKLKPKQAEP